MLEGKQILFGVSGGIAAYKAVEVVNRLRKLGAQVHVIMTPAATKLVAPLTFQTLSGNPVRTEILDEPKQWNVEHISLAERADLMIVAPATANVIGKMANGIADDYLTTEFLAVTCPVLVCPAMNFNMYAHPAVRKNLETLRSWGHRVLEPESGPLASLAVGKGRLPEPETIVRAIVDILGSGAPASRSPASGSAESGTPESGGPGVASLDGKTVIVTAGATREPIDPVRFITNRSSGKMGFAMAQAARDLGARVVVVAGLTSAKPPDGVEIIEVETAEQMRQALLSRYEMTDLVIKAAAVADFRPAKPSTQKIKKTGQPAAIELELNPDILKELGELKKGQVLVGFAAETVDTVNNAKKKLDDKNLDLIVANDVTDPGSGFGTDTNRVWLCWRDGRVEELPLMSKVELAREILGRVAPLVRE